MTLNQILKKWKLSETWVWNPDTVKEYFVSVPDLSEMLNQLVVNYEYRNKPRCPYCNKLLMLSDCEMIQKLLLKIRNKLMERME
jgi:hypothetical protein